MSQQHNPLKPGAFLEGLIRFLLPFFIGPTPDINAVRAEIIETLESFGARTRMELLTAARVIAFGMSTLDALKDAADADLSPAMKIRCRGGANALNRSTLQNEKALEQRLACDPPAQTDLIQEPVDDLPDAEAKAAFELARATIEAHRSRVMAARAGMPATSPIPNGAMLDRLHKTGPLNGSLFTG